MRHRGPDGAGLFIDELVGLAHARLSIIDRTEAGRQPMSTARTHLVVNGEVYNHRELATQFELGGLLRSRSDSEVLLHLIETIGMENTLASIDGMYAFAAYEPTHHRLHLVRDPFGVKPLFVMRRRDRIWFASELKALMSVPGFTPKASMEALHHYLSLDYIPGSLTAFEGIEEIRPGTWWTVDTRTGNVTQRAHSQTTWATDESITLEDAVHESRRLLQRAVRRQLVADVDVGIMLSGGLDSSSIAAMAVAETGSSDFHTFSIGFSDPSFNEAHHGGAVAQKLGTKHHTINVRPEDVPTTLPLVIAGIDEPYGDGSALPTYLLAERAKEHVTVLLSGEGGDEMFSGYDTHAAAVVRRRYRMLPKWIRTSLVRPLVNRLPVRHSKLSFDFKAKRFAYGAEFGSARSHFAWREVVRESDKSDLVMPPSGQSPTYALFEAAYAACASPNELQRLLHVDRTFHLPDDLMVKNDRMTMAHSIEARVPFCDRELVAYLAKVPPQFLMNGLTPKQLLRRAMADVLPESITKRKKMGLEMPYSRWMRGPLEVFTRSVLNPDRVRQTGSLIAEGVTALLDEHCAMHKDNGRALWGLLNWVLWHEHYIQGHSTS